MKLLKLSIYLCNRYNFLELYFKRKKQEEYKYVYEEKKEFGNLFSF